MNSFNNIGVYLLLSSCTMILKFPIFLYMYFAYIHKYIVKVVISIFREQNKIGLWKDGTRTNVGRDKRQTDKRRTKTNVGPRQTSDQDKRQTGQTSDQDKRRTGTNVGPGQTSDRDKRRTYKKMQNF